MGDTNHDHDDVDTTDDTADVDTDVDETEDEADTSSESENTDANDDDDDSADADDDSSEDGNDDDSKGDSDKSSDTADDTDTEDEDDGEEPELRKPKAGASNAEWAAWRAQEKAKAAKSKSGDAKDSDDKDTDSEDTDDDLSEEDAKAIDKRIGKHLEPLLKQQAEQEVEASIATFLKDNPDFAPFASKVKRFANHPSRASVPIKSIFYEVAGDKLLQIGAKRSKAADAKAKKGKTGGGNANTDGKGSKDYANMPLEDFGKELEDIKVHGKRA